jgi:hypothetical protein
MNAPEPIDFYADPRECRAALRYVGLDIAEETVQGWTREQRVEAGTWAWLERLGTSDYTGEAMPPRPAFLPLTDRPNR